jgi:hypothetical protein
MESRNLGITRTRAASLTELIQQGFHPFVTAGAEPPDGITRRAVCLSEHG